MCLQACRTQISHDTVVKLAHYNGSQTHTCVYVCVCMRVRHNAAYLQ